MTWKLTLWLVAPEASETSALFADCALLQYHSIFTYSIISYSPITILFANSVIKNVTRMKLSHYRRFAFVLYTSTDDIKRLLQASLGFAKSWFSAKINDCSQFNALWLEEIRFFLTVENLPCFLMYNRCNLFTINKKNLLFYQKKHKKYYNRHSIGYCFYKNMHFNSWKTHLYSRIQLELDYPS